MALGGLIGTLAAGPHFNEWPFLTSMGMIVGCASGTALLGYMALAIFTYSIAGGAVYSYDDVGDHDARGGSAGELSVDD